MDPRRRTIGWIALTLAILPVGMVLAGRAAQDRTHLACGVCHLASDGVPEAAASSSRRAAICERCHSGILPAEEEIPAGGSSERWGHVGASATDGVFTPPLGGALLDRFDCLSCHSPHVNGEPHQLLTGGPAYRSPDGRTFDPLTSLCLSCHPLAAEFKGSRGHFVRHPIGVRPRIAAASRGDPNRDSAGDGPITCATCHVPHASLNPFLLRWPMKDQIAECGACHRDVIDGTRG
jgi:predicted CXXCH cytochrome family protein